MNSSLLWSAPETPVAAIGSAPPSPKKNADRSCGSFLSSGAHQIEDVAYHFHDPELLFRTYLAYVLVEFLRPTGRMYPAAAMGVTPWRTSRTKGPVRTLLVLSLLLLLPGPSESHLSKADGFLPGRDSCLAGSQVGACLTLRGGGRHHHKAETFEDTRVVEEEVRPSRISRSIL